MAEFHQQTQRTLQQYVSRSGLLFPATNATSASNASLSALLPQVKLNDNSSGVGEGGSAVGLNDSYYVNVIEQQKLDIVDLEVKVAELEAMVHSVQNTLKKAYATALVRNIFVVRCWFVVLWS
jgi:hypothetical protein